MVGLGNPGNQYENTRHNVGFLGIDMLAQAVANEEWLEDKKNDTKYIKLETLLLIKPQTFMNVSGKAVSNIVNLYKIKPANIWVLHDDLDLLLGYYKIQKARGPQLHYGVKSIEEKLGIKDFWRVRIGVDNREKENRTSGEEYVLQKFNDEERVMLTKVLKEVVNKLSMVLLKSS